MSFKAEKINEQGLQITVLKNAANNTQVRILPDFGALWHGWIVERNGKEIDLIDHYKDDSDIKNNLKDSYKSGNLSPFACRIPDGKYTFKDKEYEFQNRFKDGNAIHGLLADKAFREINTAQSDDAISAAFAYEYRHEDSGYPFDYDCEVVYTLHKDNSLSLKTKVKNRSDVEIPLVDGWHPYFTTGSKIDDCRLQFYSKEIVEFDDKLIPTGELLPYDEFVVERTLKNVVLDNSFIWDDNFINPCCTFTDPQKNIKLQVCPVKNYPILQLYTPPHRNSMAIETLSGAPDAFNNGIGLVVLSPGEEREFSVDYKVEM